MHRASEARPPFDALILDLDGTLISSSALFHRAANRALERLSLAPLELARTDALLGLPWNELVSTLAPAASGAERERLAEVLHDEESALLHSELGPQMLFPGALAALDAELARGTRLAVASNCQDFYLQAVLAATRLGSRIALPLCLSTPGVRSKVDMVARALMHFGTRRAAMIGDRAHDREAARENGIAFLRFAGASYGADDLGDAPSFDRWADLPIALTRTYGTWSTSSGVDT